MIVEKTTLTSTYCGENPQNRLWYGSAAFFLKLLIISMYT